LIFGKSQQVWNRDADRLAPPWILECIAERTGVGTAMANATTLRVFEGLLFSAYKASGILTWVCSTLIYHRMREGFGMQFCPSCLKSDVAPYFRKTWRLAIKTFCPDHDEMLADRCHACEAPISFFRADMAGRGLPEGGNIALCWRCDADLRATPSTPVKFTDTDSYEWLREQIEALDAASIGDASKVRPDDLLILRTLTRLILSRKKGAGLLPHLSERVGPLPDFTYTGARPMIESLPLNVRHHLLLMGSWLMIDLEPRISDAWRHGALRYNHLLRDFETAPSWYVEMVSRIRARFEITHGAPRLDHRRSRSSRSSTRVVPASSTSPRRSDVRPKGSNDPYDRGTEEPDLL
jgi:hypothetical protein